MPVKKCLVLNMIKIYLFYFYSYKSAINVNAITTNRNASDAVLAPPSEAYGDTPACAATKVVQAEATTNAIAKEPKKRRKGEKKKDWLQWIMKVALTNV